MKRSLLAGFAFICAMMAQAQVRWDGGAGSSRWMDPLNWNEDRLPGAGDTVILDHLYQSGHYQVVLPDGDSSVSVAALIISPFFPDSIHVILPSTNWAAVGFQALAAADALVIGRGAVFLNQSGSASGTPVSVSGSGFVRIENGGHYIHNTERGHTTGLVSQLSTAVGTETGIFEFDVPGAAAYTVSVSNRVYGELRFSANASGNNKTYTGAGVNPFIVRGDFRIGRGAVFSYGSNVALLRMEANCQIDSGGRLNLANGSRPSEVQLQGNLYLYGTIQHTGTALGTIFECNGNETQHIYGNGIWQGDFVFRVNTDAELQVHQDFHLSGDLDLAKGVLRMDDDHLLSIGENALLFGSSESSFVDGWMQKRGADSFVFPVGQGGIFAPVRLGTEGEAGDTIQVRYVRANPLAIPDIDGSTEADIDHLSFVEYWQLGSGRLTGGRTVSIFAGSSSFVRDTGSLQLMSHGATGWYSLGRLSFDIAANDGPWLQGWANSMEPLTDYTFLTLGSTASVDINPLPLRILSFDAVRTSTARARFSWLLAEPPPVNTQMRLERYVDNDWMLAWDTLISELSSRRRFLAENLRVFDGGSRYRLRLQEAGGEPQYSKYVLLPALPVGERALLFPNPSAGAQWLRVDGGGKQFELRLYSASGHLIGIRNLATVVGRFDYPIDFGQFATGTYVVEIWRAGVFQQRLTLLRQ